MRNCLLAVLVVCATGSSIELILNGGFEDSLDNWTVEVDTTQPLWEVSVDSSYHEDPDNEVYVVKTNMWYARIRQTVDIPSVNLQFQVSTRMEAVEVTLGTWAYGAVVLEYRDSDDSTLGRTMVVKRSTWCPLQNADTLHLIPVFGDTWGHYGFRVGDELQNLPNIDTLDVARISLYIDTYSIGEC